MSAPRADHHAGTPGADARGLDSRAETAGRRCRRPARARQRRPRRWRPSRPHAGIALRASARGRTSPARRLDRGARHLHGVAHLVVPPKPDLHGHGHVATAFAMVSTMRRTREGWRPSAAPIPFRVKWSMGQPRLMSTKSAPRDSTRAAAQAISSALVPASCTPKHGSPSKRRISANSPLRLFEPPGDGHLAHQHPRAELDGQPPVGQVRALGHRRHDDGAGQRLSEVHALTVTYPAGMHLSHF